jgi:transcriptional regulator with XRE-family HTH domain
MDFGTFLKDYRANHRLSSTAVGEDVGCSASFISGIERGVQFPSTEMAIRILSALGVPYEEIDPVTLALYDGTTFEFKSPVRGRGRRSGNYPPTHHERIKLLEERVHSLEILVIKLLSKE